MMDVIHKEVLEITDYQKVTIKGLADILSFGIQHDKLCMWFVRDTREHYEVTIEVKVKGTGHQFESSELNGWEFKGTYQQMGGALVWHVWTKVVI